LTTGLAYLTPDEAEFLMRHVRTLPPKPKVVNVGAGAGTSGMAIMLARPEDDVTLYTVDINWSSPLGSLKGELNAFARAGLTDISQRHFQIQGDSGVIASAWAFGSVNMAFIDDGHNAPDIQRDIDGWLPIVKPGGLIAFHDYGSPNWPAVKEAVDRLVDPFHLFLGLVDTLTIYKVVYDTR
jgi:predicted O-methyltransferase YrrM